MSFFFLYLDRRNLFGLYFEVYFLTVQFIYLVSISTIEHANVLTGHEVAVSQQKRGRVKFWLEFTGLIVIINQVARHLDVVWIFGYSWKIELRIRVSCLVQENNNKKKKTFPNIKDV